jgi:acetyl esterase
MAATLERIRRAGAPRWQTMRPREARWAFEAAAEVLDLPRAPLAHVETFDLHLPDGRTRRARRYRHGRRAAERPTVLYLHGGGFVIGSLETHDSFCRQLALRTGAEVVALDYRLAPEHRFPAAFDDAFGAMRALRPQAVAGDSAGGTLAAACALMARDEGLPLALQVLITPGTAADDRFESRRRFATGYLLEAPMIDWFYDHAIDADQRRDWRFAPLEADDHAGVAPACVVLAECDPLVDEGLAYADALRGAGVPVRLELARGVTHDFMKLGRGVPAEARSAMQFVCTALEETLFR